MKESRLKTGKPKKTTTTKLANKSSKITLNVLHFVAFFISEHRNRVVQAAL